MNLNDRQKEALEYTDGPLLILAGAGSGKTRVLTNKIKYLLDEKDVSPFNILAITFTNKAAKEMKERLNQMIGNKSYSLFISTFHSLGLNIVRNNYEKLGYDKNITILDAQDGLTLIKKIMKDLNIDSKKINPNLIKNKISSCKNEMITEFSYVKSGPMDDIFIKIYKEYQNRLSIGNLVDFDDLLILPIELFEQNESVLEHYRERFKYIFIDEYQDTNKAQYTLAKMLSSKYRNICVVGDSDQSIYSWRGANYRNILNFEKDYSDAKIIILEDNYRSTKTILDAANNVIKNNKSRHEKSLKSTKGEGDKLVHLKTVDEKHEAKEVVNNINEYINNGYDLNDIAILYRTNAQSRVIEEEIRRNRINYRIVGSFYFYDRLEIKNLISYLKLIYNHKDDISLFRVINYPKRGIGDKQIKDIENLAYLESTSAYEVLREGKQLEFKNLIERLTAYSENHTLTELIDEILDKAGIRYYYESEGSVEASIRLENLEEFKSITREYEIKSGSVTLSDFLDEISLVSDKEQYVEDANKLTLMTMHASKGLEFKIVFLVGFEEGLFPHINSLNDREQLEEERRICYVAITRAMEKLIITSSSSRMLFGKTSYNSPSRFLNEIDSSLFERANPKQVTTYENKIKLDDMFIKEDITYNIHDKVSHDVYGIGIVTFVDDSIIKVAFSHNVGVKSLMKNHKSIKKI